MSKFDALAYDSAVEAREGFFQQEFGPFTLAGFTGGVAALVASPQPNWPDDLRGFWRAYRDAQVTGKCPSCGAVADESVMEHDDCILQVAHQMTRGFTDTRAWMEIEARVMQKVGRHD